MAVSTAVGVRVEVLQFSISVFLETQEIYFRDTLKVNMINIALFYVKNVLCSFTLNGFTSTINSTDVH